MNGKPLESLIDKAKEKTDDLDVKQALALALLEVISEIKTITEFRSNRQLKSISLLQTDEILKEMIQPYIENKKHYKRKYMKEMLSLAKDISKSLGNIVLNDERSLLDKMFHKNR